MRRALPAALLCVATFGAAATPPSSAPSGTAPRSIALDIACDYAPVFCEGRLRIFTREGRNQVMDLANDRAPDCSPVPIAAAVQPVACQNGVFALDASGALWKLGGGFPSTADQVHAGAIALFPGAPVPAILYPDKLRLPSGAESALAFKAEGGTRVEGGWWIFGEGRAALLGEDGARQWDWAPKKLTPRLACRSGKTIFAATREGYLVALDTKNGKERFRYRCGGEVCAPLAGPDGSVVFSAGDHAVRRVSPHGQLLWQARMGARLGFGLVAAGSGFLCAEEAGRRVALFEAKTGRELWHWEAPEGEILLPPAASGSLAAVLVSTGKPEPTLWLLTLPKSDGPKSG